MTTIPPRYKKLLPGVIRRHLPSRIFLTGLMSVLLLIWIFVTAHFLSVMNIKHTLVILKKEGCDYVLRSGQVQVVEQSASFCKIMVPYSANPLGGGGRMYVHDTVLQIADNQLVATARPLEVYPLSDAQRAWLIGWGTGMALLLILMLVTLVI